MNTMYKIREIQQTNEKAIMAFNQADYQGAVECYNKALQLCNSLPENTAFDKAKFEAIVHSGLSAAFGRQKKHMESFAAANKALAFFEQKNNEELNDIDIGKYLVAQVNQGTAFAALGCLSASLEALHKAKEIFSNSKLDPVLNKQWLESVEGNILAVKTQIEKRRELQE